MVTLEDARRVILAAEKKAIEIKQPMNIAVVDEGGNLVSHVRMDRAWLGSVDISINKLSLREHSTSQPEISRSIRNRAASFSEFTFPIVGA
jgi:uncharacterized protein GlcG (DUF336 family)